MKTVLVVCTGNICRSPMLANILKTRAANEGRHNRIRIDSAGIRAAVGASTSSEVNQLLQKHQIAQQNHRARQLIVPDLQKADLIIVFEEAHRQFIFEMAAEHLHKVYLLSEIAQENDEIADPYRRGRKAHLQAFDTINRYLSVGWPLLMEQLGEKPITPVEREQPSANQPDKLSQPDSNFSEPTVDYTTLDKTFLVRNFDLENVTSMLTTSA